MFNAQATLRRRAQEKNSYAYGTKKCMSNFKKSLTEEMEKPLIKHILELESYLFGVTSRDLGVLIYKLAERGGYHHQYYKEKQIASKEWLCSFLYGNSTLIVKKSGSNVSC